MHRKLACLAIILLGLSCSREKSVIYSEKETILFSVNGTPTDWTISPEVKPDRFMVYCTGGKCQVKLLTGIDSATYSVRENDTIRLKIILKADTALTEIIGFKALPDKTGNDEKLYWLSQLWSEIKYNFVNIDRIKFDADSLYRAFIPLVIKSDNDYEYYRLLQRFAASFHDGHTQVISDFYSYTDYIPVRFMDFDRRVYITSVRKIPGQDSSWVGAELVKIGNVPTGEFLRSQIFPYVSASTEQNLWMQGVLKLHNDLKEVEFTGTIRKKDGTELEINLPHNGEMTRTPDDEYWGPEIKFSRNIIDLSWPEKGIAILKFNRFQPQEKAISDFNKAARTLYEAKGLVIDLRNNGGGSTDVAWHLQRYLTREDHFLTFGAQTRINDGYGRSQGNWQKQYEDYFLNRAYRVELPESILVPDTLKRISCPVIILIGRYTFSAAEDFLVNISEVPGRPLMIGEETGGSTGAPLVLRGMPGGGYARICALRICYPISGKPFVNCGIKPDLEVKQTVDDYLAGKDVVLERALSELRKKLKE